MKATSTIFVAAAGTFFLIWLIASLAMRSTGVPKGFPPFTVLPLLSGVVGGYLGATVIYLILRSVVGNPNRAFLFIAMTLLALSFALPIRLSYTKSHRFFGVTPAAQMALALIHTTLATLIVAVLTSPKVFHR